MSFLIDEIIFRAILFMLDNPEPFKKARIELDQVVGPSRLPNCDDRPNLPYFEALWQSLWGELMWHPLHYFIQMKKKVTFLDLGKVEKIQEDCLYLIPSPSPSMKIQIIGGKVDLR